MTTHFGAFLRDDSGNAVSEYTIILATLAMAMIASLVLIMSESTSQLNGTQGRMTNTALTPP